MKNSNKKKKIIGAIAIMLILIILTIIITTNVVKNNGLNNGQYLATANANWILVAQYIKSGITKAKTKAKTVKNYLLIYSKIMI